jgi:hypothetical protein
MARENFLNPFFIPEPPGLDKGFGKWVVYQFENLGRKNIGEGGVLRLTVK